MDNIKHTIDKYSIEAISLPTQWVGKYAIQLAFVVLVRILTIINRSIVEMYTEEFKANASNLVTITRYVGREASFKDIDKFVKDLSRIGKKANMDRSIRNRRRLNKLAHSIATYFKVGAIKDAVGMAIAIAMSAGIVKLLPYMYKTNRLHVFKDIIGLIKKASRSSEAVVSSVEAAKNVHQLTRQLSSRNDEWDRAMLEHMEKESLQPLPRDAA